jgi:hypothetical protein
MNNIKINATCHLCKLSQIPKETCSHKKFPQTNEEKLCLIDNKTTEDILRGFPTLEQFSEKNEAKLIKESIASNLLIYQ